MGVAKKSQSRKTPLTKIIKRSNHGCKSRPLLSSRAAVSALGVEWAKGAPDTELGNGGGSEGSAENALEDCWFCGEELPCKWGDGRSGQGGNEAVGFLRFMVVVVAIQGGPPAGRSSNNLGQGCLFRRFFELKFFVKKSVITAFDSLLLLDCCQ